MFSPRFARLAAYPGIIDDSGFTSDGAAEAYTKYMRTTTSAVAARTAPSTWDLGQMAKINGGAQQHVRSPSASWIHSIGEEDDDDDEVVVLEEDRVPREWTAQVEPGVQITFVSIPGGAGNDLKRIRFKCVPIDRLRQQCIHSNELVVGLWSCDELTSQCTCACGYAAVRCSTSGRRSGGGGRTTTASWSCTTCRRSAGSRASRPRRPPSTTPRRYVDV